MANETQADVAGKSRTSNFAFLDQALWQQFRDAATVEQFARAWLALQCRFVAGATAGVVVLGEPDVGPFTPIARWPETNAVGQRLMTAAERAMSERRGVVVGSREQSQEGQAESVAQPLIIEERLFGVVALTLGDESEDARTVLRQLRWGAAWIEVLVRREQERLDEEQRERTRVAFDMVAAVLQHQRFRDACSALVTELATELHCDPVSIGFVRRHVTRLMAISHAAQFAERMNLIRDICASMDEAIDQEAVVVYPAHEDWGYRVTQAHAELALTHQAGSILTVPLSANGAIVGAITFERSPGEEFDEREVELCDAVASVVGPILEEKRRNDRPVLWKLCEASSVQLQRLFGRHYFGRKLASAVLVILVAFFAFFTADYRVTSPALIEGLVQRTIVSPFDGYLKSQHARAGEVVNIGKTLAKLDDQEIALERIRWTTRRRQSVAEYDQALAQQRRAEANIIRAQIEQADAQIALLDEQLSRTAVKAPFDGVVVSGDLSQLVGSALARGQELFKIAPLDAHRVILEVDESDINDIVVGQRGSLLLASLPETPLTYVVERVTPVAEQSEGRNYFRVEATLQSTSEGLRPGMEGVAKTEVDERLLIGIWTRKLVGWLRLTLWKWLP